MSDHISGPRALADPIADITDVYAFPSPERPGPPRAGDEHPAVRASPPTPSPTVSSTASGCARSPRARRRSVPFVAGDTRARLRLRLLRPRSRRRRSAGDQEVTCTTPSGETVLGAGERGGRWVGGGRARFRRAPLGSVHHGRTRGVEDDRDRGAGVHRSRLRSTWTARTSSAWSSRSTPPCWAAFGLVGVVAETLTRGSFNVRIERVGSARGEEHDAGDEAVRSGQP